MPSQWENRWVDYYEVLGVSYGASRDAVRHAHKTKAWLYHPDVHRGKQPAVEEEAARQFAKVQEAYDCLSDDAERRDYDRAWLMRNLLQHVWIEPSELSLGEYLEGSGHEALARFTIESDVPVGLQDVLVRLVPRPPLTDDMIVEVDLVNEKADVLFPLKVDVAISTEALTPGDIWTDLEIEFEYGGDASR